MAHEIQELFDKLKAKRDAITARSEPLKAERRAIQEQIAPLEANVRELTKQIREIENEDLFKLDMQISALARALGAKTIDVEKIK